MFGLSYLKLGIIAAIALAFAALAFTAKHYHNAWVEAETQIAVKKIELDTALAAAKVCSDNTERLKKEAEAKDKALKEAQAAAAAAAKGHQTFANSILSATPKDKNSCIAASKLLQDYKAKIAGKK
jgi:hypothetical protein